MSSHCMFCASMLHDTRYFSDRSTAKASAPAHSGEAITHESIAALRTRPPFWRSMALNAICMRHPYRVVDESASRRVSLPAASTSVCHVHVLSGGAMPAAANWSLL